MSELFSDDIIMEILLCVPVKSLIPLKCVSKTWCAIIKSKVFVQQHLKRSTQTKTNHKLIIHDRDNYDLYSIGLYPLDQTQKLVPPINHDYYSVTKLVGSCNGLLCLYYKNLGGMIAIWNPATRKHINLPKPLLEKHSGFNKVYGFGYDSVSDDYKVVIQVVDFIGVDVQNMAYSFEVNIYSLRSNSWRKSKPLFFNGSEIRFVEFSAALVCGNMHGIIIEPSMGSDTLCQYIVAFDLITEEHRIVTLPESYVDEDLCLSLSELGGCLSFASSCSDLDHAVDVWVMTVYGVKESWTKLFTVGFDPYSVSGLMFFLGKYYEIGLRVNSNRLMLYNLENRSARFSDILLPDLFCHVVCLESLVSLGEKSENDDDPEHEEEEVTAYLISMFTS